MKKTTLSLPVFLFFLLISFSACQSSTQQNTSNSTTAKASKILSVADFEKGIQASSNIQLIDVRKPEEVAAGAIDGAINYNFYDADFEEKMKALDTNKAIYVYCKSGGRSGKTVKLLNSLGFQEVYDLKGGFTAWKAAH